MERSEEMRDYTIIKVHSYDENLGKVCEDFALNMLEDKVNEYLEQGYSLLGSPQRFGDDWEIDGGFYQAVYIED